MLVLEWLQRPGGNTSPSPVFTSSPDSVTFACPNCRSTLVVKRSEISGISWIVNLSDMCDRRCADALQTLFGMASSPETSQPSPSLPE
jgi:hypothetical protein